MGNIFTHGRELKELRAKVADMERKGFYEGDNRDNEYLRRMIQSQARLISFDAFERVELYNTYRTNSVVFGIVDRMSEAASELGQFIELQDKDGNVIENHWILDLLRQPNDRFNLKRYLYAYTTNYSIFGDAFNYMERSSVGSRRGKVTGMYIMQGQLIGIEQGNAEKPIKGVHITNSTMDKPITPENYWQSFRYNIEENNYFGFSPLIAAACDVQLVRKGKERWNTSITNGGVNTIVTPARDKDGFVVPQTADAVEEELNKPENAGKSKFFRQAVEVHQLGNTPVDLSILDSSKESVTAICFAYKIPVDLYYGQSKYENAKEVKKSLYEIAAIPMVNMFCEDLMSYLRRSANLTDVEKGYNLVLNTDGIDVLKDSGTEMLQNLNLMNASINEKREAYGYNRLEGKDNPDGVYDKPIIALGTMFGADAYDITEPNE